MMKCNNEKGALPMNDDQFNQFQNNLPTTDDSYVDSYQPPTEQATDQPYAGVQPQADPQSDFGAASSDDAVNSSGASPDSEDLEAQNIFEMLGVQDGTEEEREAFLDELQQVIWEDFLENDVKLLITGEEQAELDGIMQQADLPDLERQEQIIVFLEKLVPDLEEIMLEKALELKAELFKERVMGTRDFFQGDAEKLQGLDAVSSLVDQGKWRSAASQLNAMVA
jgi:hypothetical protein